MPHAVIEYASSLEKQVSPEQICNAAYEGCVNAELFDPARIRTRAKAYEAFSVGGQRKAFLHIGVKILSGRTDEQKQQLTTSLLTSIKALGLTEVAVTIEVMDLHNESYQVAQL